MSEFKSEHTPSPAKGHSGEAADYAVEADPKKEDHQPGAPHARRAEPLSFDEKHDQLAEKKAKAETDQDALLDEAIEESFPGSDPISPSHVD